MSVINRIGRRDHTSQSQYRNSKNSSNAYSSIKSDSRQTNIGLDARSTGIYNIGNPKINKLSTLNKKIINKLKDQSEQFLDCDELENNRKKLN